MTTIASGLIGCTVYERLIDDDSDYDSDYVPRGGTIVDYDEDSLTVLRQVAGGVAFLTLARDKCQPPEPAPNRRSIKALVRAACKAEAASELPNAKVLQAVATLAASL